MHFDHIETGPLGVARSLRVVVVHTLHPGGRDLTRDMHEFVERERRGGDNLPISVSQRMVHAFPTAARRALAAGMTELQAELRPALTMNEVADAFPCGDLRVGINARA